MGLLSCWIGILRCWIFWREGNPQSKRRTNKLNLGHTGDRGALRHHCAIPTPTININLWGWHIEVVVVGKSHRYCQWMLQQYSGKGFYSVTWWPSFAAVKYVVLQHFLPPKEEGWYGSTINNWEGDQCHTFFVLVSLEKSWNIIVSSFPMPNNKSFVEGCPILWQIYT